MLWEGEWVTGHWLFFYVLSIQAMCICHSGFFPKHFYLKSMFVKICLSAQSNFHIIYVKRQENVYKEQSVCCKLSALQLLHPVERDYLAAALF